MCSGCQRSTKGCDATGAAAPAAVDCSCGCCCHTHVLSLARMGMPHQHPPPHVTHTTTLCDCSPLSVPPNTNTHTNTHTNTRPGDADGHVPPPALRTQVPAALLDPLLPALSAGSPTNLCRLTDLHLQRLSDDLLTARLRLANGFLTAPWQVPAVRARLRRRPRRLGLPVLPGDERRRRLFRE